jgi:hypothetical protein
MPSRIPCLSPLQVGLIALVVAGVLAPAGAPGQVPASDESPYALALSHILDEHVGDRTAGIVFDRFPRIDLAIRIAEERGHLARPRHELSVCEGELSEGTRECWFTADVDLLVALQYEERTTAREMTLTFFLSSQAGEAPRRRIFGGQRILELRRTEDREWVIVSDIPGIRT